MDANNNKYKSLLSIVQDAPKNLEISLDELLKFGDLSYLQSLNLESLILKEIKLKDLKIKNMKEAIDLIKNKGLAGNAAILVYRLIKDNLEASDIETGAGASFNDYRSFNGLDKCDGRSFVCYFDCFINNNEDTKTPNVNVTPKDILGFPYIDNVWYSYLKIFLPNGEADLILSFRSVEKILRSPSLSYIDFKKEEIKLYSLTYNTAEDLQLYNPQGNFNDKIGFCQRKIYDYLMLYRKTFADEIKANGLERKFEEAEKMIIEIPKDPNIVLKYLCAAYEFVKNLVLYSIRLGQYQKAKQLLFSPLKSIKVNKVEKTYKKVIGLTKEAAKLYNQKKPDQGQEKN